MTNVLANEIVRSDLKRLRDASLNCLLDSDNSFAFHIVPLSDVTPESLPKGFCLALSALLNKGKPNESDWVRDLKNLRRHFDWLPFYIQTSRSNKTRESGHFCHQTELLRSYRVSLLIDEKLQDFGVVLWTHSLEGQSDVEWNAAGGKLTPTERSYRVGNLTTAESEFLEFTSKVGNLLRLHNLQAGQDVALAWISFLVKFLWTYERPEFSRGFATVEEIRHVALNAIDHFLQSDSSSDARPPRSFLELSQRATDQDHDVEEQWPPDQGWHFRPGEVAFCKVKFRLVGKPWFVLKRLAMRSGSPVRKNDLLDAVGTDYAITDDCLRSYVFQVRDALRLAFHLDKGQKSDDPILNVERGSQCAWKINESIFNRCSKQTLVKRAAND